jgi:DNA-binding transcriptional ArsR family regulator
MTAHLHPTTEELSETALRPDRRRSPSDDPAELHEQSATADVERILDVLSDEYACRILCALDEEPLSADDLVAECDMSRPTVYRRLDDLTGVGIVDSQRSLSPEGHTRQEYHCTLSTATFHISEDGVDGTVQLTPTRS